MTIAIKLRIQNNTHMWKMPPFRMNIVFDRTKAIADVSNDHDRNNEREKWIRSAFLPTARSI